MSFALLQALSASLTEAPGVIRFGIIGTGCIGQEHLRNLHLIPECQVVAIADTHEPSLAAGRETLRKQGADGGVVCVADYRELLALPQVDAVLVATPNDHHREACHTGLEPQTSSPKAGLLLTRSSLALDRP